MKLKKKHASYLLIVLLIVLPWFNSDSDQALSIPELSQEANPYYEINPCKISFVEFLNANKRSIYQDHYFFRANNNSSIDCFGKITGISVQQKDLQTQFFISVGTNSLISILLQSLIWVLLLSLIKKSSSLSVKSNLLHNIAIVITAYILTFSIYAQQRFYDNSFFIIDLGKNSTYVTLFLIFLLISKNLIEIYLERKEKLLNMLPYIFFITGIFSGYNLILFSFIFIYSGINALFEKRFNNKLLITYLFLAFWWLINSNGSFYFKPGKFRGFTNSVYEFNSNLFWILFFVLIVLGVLRELNLNIENFSLSSFTRHFSLSSALILTFGYLGSNFPSLNFIFTYYLGLQRNIVELINPFMFDEFAVKVSWRGISPSSETIGEFFGLCLLFNLYEIVKKSKLDSYNYIGIVFSGLGLYFSDNRTSVILVFFIITLYFLIFIKPASLPRKLNYRNRLLIIASVISAFYFFFQTDMYTFFSTSLLANANITQYDSIFSSYLILLNESFEQNNFLNYIFGFVSALSYLLNRSQMWGIFFARYNPTFLELLVGSGPLTLGQVYGEVKIEELTSFLLPHSSILSYLVYFGLIPITYAIYKIWKLLMNKNYDFIFRSTLLYIFLNILKNDSLNYFNVFVFYFCILFIFSKLSIFDKNQNSIFKQ